MEVAECCAVWNGAVLAEAPRTIRLEGNHYFPPGSLNREYFTATRARSVCPWKGLARYYTIERGQSQCRQDAPGGAPARAVGPVHERAEPLAVLLALGPDAEQLAAPWAGAELSCRPRIFISAGWR